MFQDIFSISLGSALVVGAYFAYLVATKGLPAALAWLKAWWTKGKVELANLKGDVADAQAKVIAVQQTVESDVAALKAGLTTAQGDIVALKGKVGL